MKKTPKKSEINSTVKSIVCEDVDGLARVNALIESLKDKPATLKPSVIIELKSFAASLRYQANQVEEKIRQVEEVIRHVEEVVRDSEKNKK